MKQWTEPEIRASVRWALTECWFAGWISNKTKRKFESRVIYWLETKYVAALKDGGET